MTNDTAPRPGTGHRTFLPRRSRGDRKLAGVAGGLGRALRVDPVLIRVAFVVLAIFGGAGVLLYCIGWLLMPADGDEVSAVEALAGRGRSSVSTALTVVLIIVGLASAGSVFSWGLPFWPVVIAAVVVFVLVRRNGSGSCGGGTDWGRRANEFADRAAGWGARAGQWGAGRGWNRQDGDGHPGGWSSSGGPGAGPQPASPFGRPAFWEQGGAPEYGAGAPGRSATEPTGPAPAAPDEAATRSPSPEELLTQGRRTPPAWDPLGAAPFAWDLPDPAPAPAPANAVPARGRGVLGRLFVGLALATGGLLAGGVFAGWWMLSWAVVAAVALAVVGLGLLVTSLRGIGGRSLIGPGIFLSLVTLALTVTGISGTTSYGQHTWTPTSIADVQGSYSWNAGQVTLDLSQLNIPASQQVTTDLIVRGGQATILVPANANVEATCSAGVGDVNCLGTDGSGMRPEVTARQAGDGKQGTLKIEVRSNAGQAEVRTHG